jgi:hypothetical protein
MSGSFRLIRGQRGVVLATALALAVVATMLGATPAPAATPCTTPPPTVPQAQLTPGTIGNGVTALGGTSPRPFDFRVIDTIPNGWMIGLDAVVIQITGPSSFLDETGCVFFGMSGSPAYVGGRLAGAVSGVFYDDPTFGLLTPADAMVDIVEAAGSSPRASIAREIAPTDRVRRSIALASGVSPAQVTGSFQQLPVPLGVSGMSPSQITALQQRMDERGENFWIYSAGAAPAQVGEVQAIPFGPGQPLGVAVSTGDASYYATGTATFVCGDYVAAFGHPFFYDAPGEISLGLSGAKGLMILKGSSYPGSRFALLTEARGQIVQDRFAGIVGVVGVAPPSVPITSDLVNLDTGSSRVGTTEAIHTWGYWLQEIVWSHMSGNFVGVFQHLGAGSSQLGWTVEGTTESGQAFTVTNGAMVSSQWDATESLWSLVSTIDQLQFNRFEEVTFTGISATGSITKQRLEGDIVRVRVSSPLQPALKERGVVRARPGQVVTIEVTLDPLEDGPDVVTTLSVRVPRGAQGVEQVKLSGGRGLRYVDAGSFEDLVAALNGGDAENDLLVKAFGAKAAHPQDLIVNGKGGFQIQVVRNR